MLMLQSRCGKRCPKFLDTREAWKKGWGLGGKVTVYKQGNQGVLWVLIKVHQADDAPDGSATTRGIVESLGGMMRMRMVPAGNEPSGDA